MTAAQTNDTKETSDDQEEWINLMSTDLQMKIVQPSSDDDDGVHDSQEHVSCNVGDAVLVDFVGYRAVNRDETRKPKDTTNDTPEEKTTPTWERGEEFQNVQDWWIIIGDRDITPAVEMAIRFMSIGQHSIVQSHSKFAHGPSPRTHPSSSYELPPFSSVIYQVHPKAIVKSTDSSKFTTPDFQIQLAMNCKTIGNDIYQNEWDGHDDYGKNKTLRLYQKGADAMTQLLQSLETQQQQQQQENDEANQTPQEEEGDNSTNSAASSSSSNVTTSVSKINHRKKQEAQDVLVDCLNNVAAVHLRAKDYRKAKEAATQVLIHKRQNVKGLCRAARACMLDPSSTYEESDLAIQAAETVDAKHPDVLKLRAELTKRKHAYKTKNKQMYSKMAKAMKLTSTPPPPPPPPATQKEEDAKKTTHEAAVSQHQEQQDATESESWWYQNKSRLIFQIVLFLIQLIVFKLALNKKNSIIPTTLNDDSTDRREELSPLNPDQEF